MDSDDLTVLIWNVRGLNDSAHRELVREAVVYSRPCLVCLQETKLSYFNDIIARETLGHNLDSYMLEPIHRSTRNDDERRRRGDHGAFGANK